MNAGQALAEGARRLGHLAAARREARWLLADLLGITPTALLGHPETPVPPATLAAFRAALDRRAGGEPFAYIVGHRAFWSLDLLVSNASLIPRPDSETLIEAALATCRPARILDLGTGTGCLLLAALTLFPDAWGLGTDRVAAAVTLARMNAARVRLAGRAAFLCADWAAPLAGTFDLILSNPPYIETAAIPALMAEVAEHEPASALDGGADGLDAYRALLPALPALLAQGGVVILELGAGQAGAVSALAAQAGFDASTRTDLGGIPRALILRAAGPTPA